MKTRKELVDRIVAAVEIDDAETREAVATALVEEFGFQERAGFASSSLGLVLRLDFKECIPLLTSIARIAIASLSTVATPAKTAFEVVSAVQALLEFVRTLRRSAAWIGVREAFLVEQLSHFKDGASAEVLAEWLHDDLGSVREVLEKLADGDAPIVEQKPDGMWMALA